ncbi:DUF3006 family protein [Sporosarcina limicola]|uniref:DUF3006 domain-containing protein n=1 Tax=Sporosarcina limicola TaxID=34101 RepID=A0A927MKF3_9BACL|nr:DUF3006 family protein [Sporosarcina limicola]MBE1556355.1 hypothetical protein [Sporosarcina limicola]
MIRTGKYTVESIENDQVKLLSKEDETIAELLPVESFSFEIKEGDIVSVESNGSESGFEITLLETETNEMKSKVGDLLEKLKNKK